MQEMVLNLGPTPDPNDGLVQLLQKRCNTTDWQAIRNAILGGPIPNTFFDQKFPTKEELMAERVAQIERMSEESAKDLATTSKEHLEQQDLTEEGHRKRMRVHAGKTNEGDMDVNMEG